VDCGAGALVMVTPLGVFTWKLERPVRVTSPAAW
jgi:hypothetical protein